MSKNSKQNAFSSDFAPIQYDIMWVIIETDLLWRDIKLTEVQRFDSYHSVDVISTGDGRHSLTFTVSVEFIH